MNNCERYRPDAMAPSHVAADILVGYVWAIRPRTSVRSSGVGVHDGSFR